MEDRLSELRRNNDASVVQIPEDDAGIAEYGEDLDECFTQVDKIARATGLIEEHCSKLKTVHKTITTTVGKQKEEALDRHKELMHKVKDLNKTALNGLKRLQLEIKTAEGGPERDTAEFRIKKSQYSTLTRNLRQVMMEYNDIEADLRKDMKNMVQKKLRTAGSSSQISDDQLEEMIESKDSILAQDILLSVAHKREDLKELDERKREMMKLEEDILELQEMFVDMMLLVDDQEDLVDLIENQVEKATVYVQKGQVKAAAAVKLKRNNATLKWVVCIVISVVVGVLLLVIGVVVAFVVGIQSGND